MAEMLLDGLLSGEIESLVVIEAIRNDVPIKIKDLSVPILHFVPHFLAYLHDKLTPPVDSRAVYYSPRQIEEKKKKEKKNPKKREGDNTKKSARISLQYANSSPMPKMSNKSSSIAVFNGISPIKEGSKTSSQWLGSRTDHISFNRSHESMNGSSEFELNSFEDFPSISMSTQSKNPRRITATPVNGGKISVSIFQPELSSSSSLLEESSFESKNKDPSLSKLFVDDKRFTKSMKSSSSQEESEFMSSCKQALKDVDMTKFSSSNNSIMNGKTTVTPTKESLEVMNVEQVHYKEVLNCLVELYTSICVLNFVPNLTLELYFLFTILTYPCKCKHTKTFSQPFSNIESCIYFAAKSIQNLGKFLVLLDVKSLQLLVGNSRLIKYANKEFIPRMQDAIECDINSELDNSVFIKSPVTGIPFQVESDNRKSFLTDKHFYSFSKMRDAFYSLVREWQDNYLNPDWNLNLFMIRKVSDLMKNNDDVSNHYQFARLFVAQLLEMCRNNVGGKTDEPDTSDSVLLQLKQQNPTKFQSLQDRLTQPSLGHDPCPKPSFSMAEEFFKEFIRIADGYCFTKFLVHVLTSDILTIDSKSFGLDGRVNQQLNKSDFAESLWQEIKKAISELRLLAKFLGYVVFLPYNSSNHLNENAVLQSRHLIAEPLNFYKCLHNSFNNKRLLITIPWVVDFFSMADKRSLDLDVYSKPLKYLASIYRCCKMRLDDKSFAVLQLVLILHLGWLFELPQFENMNFYDFISDVEECNFTTVGIDDIVVVDKRFLYSLCPYLADIKKPLVDFAKGTNLPVTGSFRKITPVRTCDAFSDSLDSKRNLKIQLLDNFMRYLPTHVKDCMKFITERHFINIKHHISDDIIPLCCQDVVDHVKEGFSTNDLQEVTPENLKLHNQSLYSNCFKNGKNEVATRSHVYLQNYMKDKILVSVQSLLPDSTHKKMVDVSAKVVKHNIRLKVQEWMTANGDLFMNVVENLYKRHVMSIVKTANKES